MLTAKILRKLMDQELLQKRLSVQSLLPIPVTYEQSEQQTGCRTAKMGRISYVGSCIAQRHDRLQSQPYSESRPGRNSPPVEKNTPPAAQSNFNLGI